LAVRRLVKIGVFYICFLRIFKSIGNLKENRTLMVRCIFWWEYACINRAENKQEFTDLMQRVKEFRDKWLNTKDCDT